MSGRFTRWHPLAAHTHCACSLDVDLCSVGALNSEVSVSLRHSSKRPMPWSFAMGHCVFFTDLPKLGSEADAVTGAKRRARVVRTLNGFITLLYSLLEPAWSPAALINSNRIIRGRWRDCHGPNKHRPRKFRRRHYNLFRMCSPRLVHRILDAVFANPYNPRIGGDGLVGIVQGGTAAGQHDEREDDSESNARM